MHITQLYMNAQEATNNMAEDAETTTAHETRARQRDGACDKSRVELPHTSEMEAGSEERACA